MTIPLTVDAESAVQLWLQNRFPTARSVVVLPQALVAALPLYKTRMLGGPQKLSFTAARIEVQAFTLGGADVPAGRASVLALCGAAVNAMCREMPGTTTLGVTVTAVAVNSAPSILEYENPNVWRAVALFDVYCHPGL